MDEKDLINLIEAARITRRPVVTVRYWAQHGHIWCRKFGGRSWVVSKQDVMAYARKRRRGGGRP